MQQLPRGRVTKAMLPKLVASGDGHVVIVGSVAGLEAYPGGGGYNAAKFGIRGAPRDQAGAGRVHRRSD